jgi:hypothetical protein
MKKEIAKNEYYEIHVDQGINRVYKVMRGHWKKLADVYDYKRHNLEAMSYLEPGFTTLLDIREMQLPSDEVLDLMVGVSKDSEEAGQGRQAQVINKKDLGIVRKGRNVIKESDMDLKMMQFGTIEEAVEWLDR